MKGPSSSPAGELLMLRLVAPCWSSSIERQLRALEPGGILLAGPLPRSPETLYDLLGGISRSLPAPPILALEAEGGADPLNALLYPLPTPRALAQKGARLARQAGELIGEALKLLGFNTYFALTLDLASEFTGESLGASTFSADPRVVAECGAFFVEGLSRQKILACAAHFPGLSSVPPAADRELSISGRSMAELWRSDLVPYRELLPRLPLVLMSAAAYKAYDFDYPRSAVLSVQIVDGLLRAKLGYRGVVVAPQLESQPVRGALDMGQAAVQSLYSGCDMLLVEKDESWQALRHGIEEALASGVLPRERLDLSVARIRAAKKGLALPKGAFSKKAWERLARRFEEFGSLT
jgi:beta-glucosidase-like glycosyl hydrolase